MTRVMYVYADTGTLFRGIKTQGSKYQTEKN
jgi:hypothetical protein